MVENQIQGLELAARKVIENWEHGDLAAAVRGLDSSLQDFDSKAVDELIECLRISHGIILWAADHGAAPEAITAIENKVRKALAKFEGEK